MVVMTTAKWLLNSWCWKYPRKELGS